MRNLIFALLTLSLTSHLCAMEPWWAEEGEYTKEGEYEDAEFLSIDDHQLFKAVKQGDTQKAKELLNSGAHVNACEQKHRTTALMWATKHEPMVRLLINHGADINAQDALGYTALMLAADGGHEATCNLLLRREAKVNLHHIEGWTALTLALLNDHFSIATALVAHGADINAKTALNLTPLLLLTTNEAVFITHRINEVAAASEMLLKRSANIHARDYQKRTSLMIAAHQNYSPACSRIITHARFNPLRHDWHIAQSRKLIFAALCTLRKACPHLPRDLRYFILTRMPELQEDMRNSACAFHKNQHDRTPFLPVQVVRALLRDGLLNPTLTIEHLKAHHAKQLAPLMIEAADQTDDETLAALLDPARLDEHYGKEIEASIRGMVGIPSGTKRARLS